MAKAFGVSFTMIMRNIGLFLSLVLFQAGVVRSEIVPLDIVLDASADEVHYIRGWLEAPATIDLSSVVFETEPFDGGDDTYNDGEFVDDDTPQNDDGGAFPKTDDDGDDFKTPAPSPADIDSSTPSPSKTPANGSVSDSGSGSDSGSSIAGSDSGSSIAGSDSGSSGNSNVDSGSDTGGATVSGSGSGSDAGSNSGSGSGGDDVSSGQDSGTSGGGGGKSPTSAPTAVHHGGAHNGGGQHNNATPNNGGEHHNSTQNNGGGQHHNSTQNNGGGQHNGGGGHHTAAPSAPPGNRQLQSQRVAQVVDLVLFMIPAGCKKDFYGNCDWSTLGIGAADNYVEGDISYCCSIDTVDRGVCTSDDVGKLIVDPVLFSGKRVTIEVPTGADREKFFVPEDSAKFDITETGDYVLLMGNCFDDGVEVLELGSMEWKSVSGYLPGDMYGLMVFHAILSIYYFVLYIWYSFGMRIFQDSAIPIQKYIVSTMFLGFLEFIFRAVDLGYWNLAGTRAKPLLYVALGIGVLKDGLSRVLGVMVGKGWGIVRESLGRTMIKIIFLGLVYTGLAGFRDFSLIIADEDVQKLSITAEEELIDFALILTPLIIVLNLIFYFWILNSLNGTTDYLRNMNQTTKLRRHLKLRCLMIASMTIAAVWLSFTVLDVVSGGILAGDQLWFMEALMHVNYAFVLTGVAILWRPNANAKDYAMQMQIPTGGDDDENDLELSCVVPSATSMESMDGNDPDHPNGIRVTEGRFS